MGRLAQFENATEVEASIHELIAYSPPNRSAKVKRVAANSTIEFPATKFTKWNRRKGTPSSIAISLNGVRTRSELLLLPEHFVKYVKLTVAICNIDGEDNLVIYGILAKPSDFLRRQWGFGFLRDYSEREGTIVEKSIICSF